LHTDTQIEKDHRQRSAIVSGGCIAARKSRRCKASSLLVESKRLEFLLLRVDRGENPSASYFPPVKNQLLNFATRTREDLPGDSLALAILHRVVHMAAAYY
jgi:hypothetical protein